VEVLLAVIGLVALVVGVVVLGWVAMRRRSR